jgi:hypothetical protein
MSKWHLEYSIPTKMAQLLWMILMIFLIAMVDLRWIRRCGTICWPRLIRMEMEKSVSKNSKKQWPICSGKA